MKGTTTLTNRIVTPTTKTTTAKMHWHLNMKRERNNLQTIRLF